jgi:penicillin amidase
LAPRLAEVLFAHPLAIASATRDRFNVGPFTVAGSVSTVQSLSGTAPDRRVGPSLRVVFDVADWDRSIATMAPGQSELPDSQHFRDLAALWAQGQYFSLPFTDAAVGGHAVDVLTIAPARARSSEPAR